MRTISSLPIIFFTLITTVGVILSLTLTYYVTSILGFSFDFNLKNLVVFFPFLYTYIVIVYRLLISLFDFSPGIVLPDSRKEKLFHLRVLIDLFFFVPVAVSGFLPHPLSRLFYIMLGARLGDGSYPSACTFCDPLFITAGQNVIFGNHSTLSPHIMNSERLEYQPITIGDRVTIGGNVGIYGGVTIDDDAVILFGSGVVPGTHIKKGEVWGGNPARKKR